MINLKDYSGISWVNWGNTIKPTDTANSNVFLKNFDILDKKVNAATRTLDYYDLYKFVGSVDSLDSYRIAYASLANNRALSVVNDFDKYHCGDIILKDDFGNEIHIPTKQAGIFVPSHYSLDNPSNPTQLIFNYRVFNNMNQLPTSVGEGDIAYNNNEATVSLPIFGGDLIYQIFIKNEGESSLLQSIPLQTRNSVTVYPVIKVYDASGEEIYMDQISYQSNTLTVTIQPGWTLVVR